MSLVGIRCHRLPQFWQSFVCESFTLTSSDGSGTINGRAFVLVTNGQLAFAIPIKVDGLLYVIEQWLRDLKTNANRPSSKSRKSC